MWIHLSNMSVNIANAHTIQPKEDGTISISFGSSNVTIPSAAAPAVAKAIQAPEESWIAKASKA